MAEFHECGKPLSSNKRKNDESTFTSNEEMEKRLDVYIKMFLANVK